MMWNLVIWSCLVTSTLAGKLFFKPKLQLENILCPDGLTTCPKETSCCSTVNGQYKCCDISEVESSVQKMSAVTSDVGSVVCPNTSFMCPDSTTCCPLAGGKLGCCPISHAVCCADGVHCCPSGFKCDLSHGVCRKGTEQLPWLMKILAKPISKFEPSDLTLTSAIDLEHNPHCVVCPDGRSQCPDGTTCCVMPGGIYGCCPLPDAVCCPDHIHCCPHFTTCDMQKGQCDGVAGESYPWMVTFPVASVKCDAYKQCQTGQTCCKLASGQWGCCPLPQAVCCSDGIHCCPHDTTCDVSQGRCIRQDGTSYPWLHKSTAMSRKVEDVHCDPQFSCPSGDTCCKLKTGQWGCCPLPQAVCCSDGVHCCPHDTTCDVSQGRCIRQDGTSYPWLHKSTAMSRKVEDVHCDSQFSCPSGDTCCKLKTGQWGCCPLPQAVCCSDGVHCCPHDTTCDVSQGRCIRQDGTSYLWLHKSTAMSRKVEDVHCDSQFSCPSGDTCCKLKTGQWGCCPLPQAVCCSDGVHCCPHDTTCDVSQGRCIRQDGTSYPWLHKSTAMSRKVEDVHCDSQFSCPSGNTCCKLKTGQWGCCPLPQAVCCSDGVHCCPHDTTCDVSQGRCIRQDGTSYPWLHKSTAMSRKVEDVHCDSQFSCPSGDTCCKLKTGQWGCCPLPQAVCCSDGVHCCPHDTTCDVSQGRCIRQDGTSYPWLHKSTAMSRKVEDVHCDSQFSCPSGNTCCKLKTGQWGCCPLPQAVCCSDGVHCCPHDTTCDVSQGRCIRQDGTSYPWLHKSTAMSRKVEDVHCDSQFSCPSGDTCCKLKTGQWGCCPLPQAVCCSDGVHCCPHDTTCDVSQGRCIRQDGTSYPWLHKSTAMSRKVEDVHCDSQFSCPSGNTCCKLKTGQWGCCPLPQAVCCSDGVHCCPHDTTCDVSQGRCIRQDGTSYPWLHKSTAMSRKVEDVHCDSQFSCPSGDTCCKLKTGQWGCCPLPQAVCCSDGVHCCPHDTTCDVSQGRCIRQDGTSYPWLHKSTAMSRKVEDVHCDSQFSCPSGNTCCKLKTGQWGCCPLPQAVCCSDGVHCCPHDTTCDVSQGRCIRQDGTSYPWLHKSTAMSRKVEDVHCDSQFSCPSGDTCCKLKTGQWGCCPLPQAVCCSDGVHCCPHDTTCDVSQGRCIRQDGTSYPWLHKSTAMSRKVEDVHCDSQFSCPSGNTCCKLKTGQWGCCPLPQAVCCSDGVHCCPHDTTCDVSQGRCIRQDGTSYPWLHKSTAMSRKVEDVHCDSQFSCPSGDTCCKLKTGQWGCCPLPQAVCCSDGVHCCPHDTTCDVSQGRCIRQDGTSYPWLHKSTAMSRKVEDVHCDSQFSCPSGDTCCKLKTGQWGCCPLPQAVCCSDGVHCCPHDTTCDVSQGRCIRQDGTSYPWLHKSTAMSRKVEDIHCDSQFSCPSGDTCCKLKTGQWGCCPLPRAVCCSDGVHCCPHDTTCDVSQGRCIRQDGTSYPWLHKSTAMSRKVEDVHCDSQFSCPSGDTCCKLKTGQWGCCPLPQAVCCSDGVHCCPHDTTCDVSQGRCIRQDGTSYPWLHKSTAMSRKVEDVHCDSQFSCPSGDTCCKLKTGQWGCCPLPQAVCCSDGVHCCPHDTTCDVSQGRCIRQDGTSYPWLHKSTAMSRKVEDVHCDSQFSCPSGDTCCKLKTGQWGCCPLPQAVCCSDGVHCCPHDTTCDVSQGRCIRQDGTSYPWLHKSTAMSRKVEDIHCDSQFSCPSGDTCCKLKTGQWGCCPLPRAVCCSDGVHCCPHDTTCDVSQGRCIRQDGTSYPWLHKSTAMSRKVEDVHCDSQFSCPSGDTCCKLKTGQWGCCPLPQAVCCSDGVHCCPHDTTCDVSQGRCIRQDGTSYPWLHKSTAMSRKVEDVHCDSQYSCPSGDTCCKLKTGQWGCCPLPQAVCCSDGVHCCPHDTTCDVSQGRCIRQDGTSYPWLHKSTAMSRKVEDVHCDSQFSCPSGDTCCKLKTGQWGCCPLPQAVCCSDGVHCCPHDTTCDVSQGRCIRQDGTSYPWLHKSTAMSRKVEDVHCDPQFSCPSGDTCCKLKTGQWGCCPLPQAVCCSDGIHCCPHDTTCDVSHGKCIRQDGTSYPWLLKSPAMFHQVQIISVSQQASNNIICPDQKTECSDGTTCCKEKSGRYGCCPYEEAICCSDGLHCCPKGTTCDLSTGMCNAGSTKLPWQNKLMAASKPKNTITCPDSKRCPDKFTCCHIGSNKYGCCPLANATCCADMVHCCPQGNTCDPYTGACIKPNNVIPFIHRP